MSAHHSENSNDYEINTPTFPLDYGNDRAYALSELFGLVHGPGAVRRVSKPVD